MKPSHQSTVRILYFPGCPNHEPAVELVRRVLDDHQIDAHLEEIEVGDADEAQTERFFGSPTIQVDGVDIEPAARERSDYSYSCRTYDGQGLPSEAMIESALREAACEGACAERRSGGSVGARAGAMSGAASGLAAVAASACCWAPLALIGLGVSSAGVSALLWEWRPWLLAGAVVLLAGGFGLTTWRAGRCCDARERRMLRVSRGVLWVSAALVGLSVVAPDVVDDALKRSLGGTNASGASDAGLVELRIDGMHCAACAVTVRDALEGVDGVTHATIDYDKATARIERSGEVASDSLIEAVESAGYGAHTLNQAGSNRRTEKAADQGDSR